MICYVRYISLFFHYVALNSYSYTEIPTKDESSETTVQNLYCPCFLLIMITCNCKIVPFFAKLFNQPYQDFIF